MLSKAQEAALQALRECAADIDEHRRLGHDCEPINKLCCGVIEIDKDHFEIKEGGSIPDGPLKEVIVELCDNLMKNKYSRIAANLAKKYSL
jgi:hypothetical protein